MLSRKSTRAVFSWNVTKEDAIRALTTAYEVEVLSRGRQYTPNPEISRYIEDVAVFMCSPNHKQGLLFMGNPGNGKTTMTDAIQSASNILIRSRLVRGSGWTGISKVHALEVSDAAVNDRKTYKLWIDTPLLAVDDVGTEPSEVMSYGNSISPIVELIERRYESQLFTIISTNIPPADLRPRYGDRVADRFNEMFHKVIFKNSTFR